MASKWKNAFELQPGDRVRISGMKRSGTYSYHTARQIISRNDKTIEVEYAREDPDSKTYRYSQRHRLSAQLEII